MSALKIARAFELPIEAVTQTFAILAKRGAGKTYTASVMVEEMLDKHLPVVILDPLGVWWGLQSSVDGKRAGYPITVLGGEHGDVPLEPTAGETIADFVVNEKQSVVLDLSDFRKADQIRFATAFLERLYQKNRDPLHLVVDEADLFAPQSSPKGHEARVLGAMEDLSRRGRARGIGMTLVTQRSAVLNKNVLTQIEVLIVMRTTSPQDRKAIKAWVDVHGEEEEWREMDNALPKLDIGTAYIWSPGWLDVFKQIKVRLRRTFDSSATPKVGEKRIVPTNRAEPDLDALREQIASTIEEAKRNDPAELRKKIAELKSELAKKPEAPEPEVIEVPTFIFGEELRDDLHEILARLRGNCDLLGGQVTVMEKAVETAEKLADVPEMKDREMSFTPPPRPRPGSTELGQPRGGPTKPRPDLDAKPKAQPDLDTPLTGPQQRVLDSLAWLEAVGFDQPTKIQCGFIAGYRVGKNVGGTFGNILGQLRGRGLLDYPMTNHVSLTAEGRGAASLPDIEQTTAGLQQAIYDRLTGPEEKVLRVLVEAYPEALDKQECGARSGYTVGPNVGGTFGNILGKLRTLGLADYPQRNYVMATSVLFID